MEVALRREHFRKGLSNLYLPYYDALCERLGPRWQPYSGLRTFDEQTGLYAKGRTVFPYGPQFVVTNAKAGQSAHNYGCASDWTLWDDEEKPIWMTKDDPRWQVYIQAIQGVGLKAGADFGDYPHNELALTCSWTHVLLVFQQGGMTAAQQKIEVALKR